MNNYQLSEQQLQALRVEHRRQLRISGRAADKVKAVYLLGSGWRVQAVCEALLMDDNTVRNYQRAYASGGVNELVKTDYQGSEKKLTEGELELLDAHLMEVVYLRVKDIVAYVKKTFDEDYSISGMTDLLKQLDYRYKKPMKVPAKIDINAQKAFIRLYRKIRKEIGPADGVYFMDAVHPQLNPVAGYGWIKRGEVRTLRSNPVPSRLSINGAINIQSLETVIQYEKRLTKETTKDFLEQLRRHQPQGKLYLICDNAGYYTSPEITAYAQSMAIAVIYLPPYSPNLNLIERLWRYLQKHVLSNHCYQSLAQIKQACMEFFKGLNKQEEQLRSMFTEKFQTLPI